MNHTETQNYGILPPSLAVQAMRSSGYKNTAYAIAELIDNSIQSGEIVSDKPTEVEVICIEQPAHLGTRTVYRMAEVAIYDNAAGMDSNTLRGALQFGHGTNLDPEQQKGMGKFGMGLPNASISQCKRLDVYSWKNGTCFHTYLDIEEIKKGQMTDVPVPTISNFPEKWNKLIESEVSDSGTLVVWNDIDRSTWTRSKTFFKNAEFIIGRMYRHFLVNGKARVRFSAYSKEGDTNYQLIDKIVVRPNDPLMLMPGTTAPNPYDTTPAFNGWGEPEEFKITLPGGQISAVTIKYSMASEEARNTGGSGRSAGSMPLGKFVSKNLGVSIVRAGRELELNTSWNSPSEPRERWWGVEISFEPQLDDIFGVTNNKQSATKLVRCDLKEDAQQEEMSVNDFIAYLTDSQDPKLAVYQISTAVEKRISVMMAHIRKQKEGERATSKGVPGEDAAESLASKATNMRIAQIGEKGRSDINPQASDENRRISISEALIDSGVSSSDAERIAIQSIEKNLRYIFTKAELHSPAIFDVQERSGDLFVKLNINHPVQEHLFELLEEDIGDEEKLVDSPALTGLKLLFMAWARMEDEAAERELETLQEIRITWGKITRDFFRGNED
jgi:hypothetical protein